MKGREEMRPKMKKIRDNKDEEKEIFFKYKKKL